MRSRPFGATKRDVPTIGQGTWNFPERGSAVADAKTALLEGIDLGLVHIDTAEMYGNGRAEEIVGEVIRGVPREALFVVSKVLPSNATYEGTLRACEASLRRLGTEYLDCFLLHWRGAHELGETMRAMEHLIDEGKIRSLGVSNFDVDDLEQARAYLQKYPIACNQVLYHLAERSAERHVLPYCREHGIALVGYSPFGSGDFPSPRSRGGRVLNAVAERRGASMHAVTLAFLTRTDATFVIPKAARPAHVRDNATASDVELDEKDIAEIAQAFPLPSRDGPLATL